MNRIQKHMSLGLYMLMMVFPMFLMAQSDKNLVRQGNQDYQKGAYNEAEINYRKALDKNPTNTVAQFNLGGAMYSQENYEKAAEVYSATDIKEKTAEEKSAVYYNLGNSMLKAGKSDEATAAYKQALRENPKNEEARYNLEYLRQKQQQEQNKDDNKDDKKDQDKKDQDQNKDQEKQDQDKKDQKQDQQDQNKDQQDKQQDQSQDKQDQQQGKQNEQQSQKISKKDAERMLDALKNNEKKTLEKLKKAKKKNAKVIKSEKDW